MEPEPQLDAALAPMDLASNLIIKNVSNYNSFLLFLFNHIGTVLVLIYIKKKS
jgi:hypothetical protein